MIKPITPDEVVAEKEHLLPDEVFEAVNQLIAKHWNGTYATVLQSEVVGQLEATMGLTSREIFTRKLLDFEPVYRGAGWKVRYDKPGYSESYGAFFQFSRAA